jgi:glycosyltransferase involved in cell wall biosynthesis
MSSGAAGSAAVPDAPWFALTMTVHNNAATIARTLSSLLPELNAGGELGIVDAASTDGTLEAIGAVAGHDPRVHVISEPCNRGEGRNRAVAMTRAPIVVSQLDADNLYFPSVLSHAAQALRRAPGEVVLSAVGADDPNPSSTRFFVWRRATFERLHGYPRVQVAEELGLVLRAYRAEVRFQRFVVPRVADDLKPRAPAHGATVGPWRRGRVTMRAAKKFGVLGYSYGEFVRYLGMTRRTTLRYLAGVALGAVGYLAYRASGRDDSFLNDGLGETAQDVAGSVSSPDWPSRG